MVQHILNILGLKGQSNFDFYNKLIECDLQTNTHILDFCVVRMIEYISPSNRLLLLNLKIN